MITSYKKFLESIGYDISVEELNDIITMLSDDGGHASTKFGIIEDTKNFDMFNISCTLFLEAKTESHLTIIRNILERLEMLVDIVSHQPSVRFNSSVNKVDVIPGNEFKSSNLTNSDLYVNTKYIFSFPFGKVKEVSVTLTQEEIDMMNELISLDHESMRGQNKNASQVAKSINFRDETTLNVQQYIDLRDFLNLDFETLVYEISYGAEEMYLLDDFRYKIKNDVNL